jgi:rubrerythrin
MEKRAIEFVHPFPGKSPGDPLTKQEVISAIRLSLCAEEEATHLYDTIADYVDDERVQKIMKDVATEEQVHAGEFQHLLNLLEEDEEESLDEGEQEAKEKLLEKEGAAPLPHRVAAEALWAALMPKGHAARRKIQEAIRKGTSSLTKKASFKRGFAGELGKISLGQERKFFVGKAGPAQTYVTKMQKAKSRPAKDFWKERIFSGVKTREVPIKGTRAASPA